jgi:hypothetical protein
MSIAKKEQDCNLVIHFETSQKTAELMVIIMISKSCKLETNKSHNYFACVSASRNLSTW